MQFNEPNQYPVVVESAPIRIAKKSLAQFQVLRGSSHLTAKVRIDKDSEPGFRRAIMELQPGAKLTLLGNIVDDEGKTTILAVGATSLEIALAKLGGALRSRKRGSRTKTSKSAFPERAASAFPQRPVKFFTPPRVKTMIKQAPHPYNLAGQISDVTERTNTAGKTYATANFRTVIRGKLTDKMIIVSGAMSTEMNALIATGRQIKLRAIFTGSMLEVESFLPENAKLNLLNERQGQLAL